MIESFFRMKSTAKQEHNLNLKRNSYIPKMCVDPCPVGSTTSAKMLSLWVKLHKTQVAAEIAGEAAAGQGPVKVLKEM